LIESPVSAGVLVPEANCRFSVAEGVVVLLPVGSTSQRKPWLTAAWVLLWYEDACKSSELELAPEDEVAVFVAGSTVPAAESVPEKLAVVPVSAPLRLAELPDSIPVAIMLPLTLWSFVNVLAPVEAYDPAG